MEHKEKLISIIIPVYNVAQYLPECLLSLDRQKFADDPLSAPDWSKVDGVLARERARSDEYLRKALGIA